MGDLQKAELKSEVGDRKEGPSLLSVSGDLGSGKQAVGLEIRSYSPNSKPGQQQVRDSETRKAEQGETSGVGKKLPSASKYLSSTSVKLSARPNTRFLSGVLDWFTTIKGGRN